MTGLVGIIAAFIAFLGWGFGDFAAQRAIRKIGSLEVLFFSGLAGAVVLYPFVHRDIGTFFSDSRTLWLLVATGVMTVFASFFGAEALRKGKISVVEPVISFELVLSALIGVTILGESVSIVQGILILGVFVGMLLTVLRVSTPSWWQIWRVHVRSRMEAGVLLAAGAAVTYAIVNVLTGVSSRASSPVATIWFMDVCIVVVSFAWFVASRRMDDLFGWSRQHWRPLVVASVLDDVAWLAYAFAVTVIPISIAVAITESYVALAALLGITITKERLQRHQIIGIIVTVIAGVALAVLSG